MIQVMVGDARDTAKCLVLLAVILVASLLLAEGYQRALGLVLR